MATPKALQLCLALSMLPAAVAGLNNLSKTPPMGWMSWEIFRCEIDCDADPDNCINEDLYRAMGDHLAADGYVAAGYETVSIDDCWESKDRQPGDPLAMNASRFPGGPTNLSTHLHSRGVKFGIYSDEGTLTCGGYPGSEGTEQQDADTLASWGVDYLKLDGCNNDAAGYATGYPAMGSALQATGRDVVFSCSWPAYLGDDEGAKPFDDMVAAGCNLWRNWHDIQCEWDSLKSIIDHWGNYSESLAAAAGPGHWNDPDMLLVGNDCITDLEAETQMAIWSITAAPLIMGNDLRKISPAMKALLQNPEVIAVDQDPLGKAGKRLGAAPAAVDVWTRPLANGDLAVVVYFDGAEGGAILDFDSVGWDAPASTAVRDVLARSDMGAYGPKDTIPLQSPGAHGVRFLRLSDASA